MKPQIRFFYCGAGDTILLGVDGAWALIDCNLTGATGARERVLEVLKKHHVKRLRFACITHYDSDHLYGMARLFRERFSKKLRGRREERRWFLEQIIQPLPALDIDRAGPVLQHAFERIHKSKIALGFSQQALDLLLTTRQMLKDSRSDTDPNGVYLRTYHVGEFLVNAPAQAGKRSPFGPFDVCFLAPEQQTMDRFETDKLRELSVGAPADVLLRTVSDNATSRVLVLRHRDTKQTVLFGGDAPTACWARIIQRWQEISSIKVPAGAAPQTEKFHVVKVSHHGSVHSHHPLLYSSWCIPQETKAVISSRLDDPDHPHPTVTEDLSTNGMIVHLTRGGGVTQGVPKAGAVAGGHRVPSKSPAALPPADILVEFTSDGPKVTRIPI